MFKKLLALSVVLVMALSLVSCSNVGKSTANNRPGDFIFNAVENTDEKYTQSIKDVADIFSDAVNGGSIRFSYNDSHYSVDNILYMDAENAKYTNLLDGQIYGENVNLLLQYDNSDITMWSDTDLFTYDLYEGNFNAYKFDAEMVATMFHDNFNTEDKKADVATNPTNFDWLLYQLTRIMQINEDFKEDLQDDVKDLFNKKFDRYSVENVTAEVDGTQVKCVELKYNLDEYDVAQLLETVLNDYLDYFYYLGATGIQKQCFVITDALEQIKAYVEKSFVNLDLTLTVAKDTKAIVTVAVSGTVDIAGEEATVEGNLSLGRNASYLTPVTGVLTVNKGADMYEYSIRTDATSAEGINNYRLSLEGKQNGTVKQFVDAYYTFNSNDSTFSFYTNTNGDVIQFDGALTIDEGKEFEITNTYLKLGKDEYYPDFKIIVKAKAAMPKAPSNPCVIEEEYDEEGYLAYSAYDSLVDIIDNEVRTTGVFQYYDSVKDLVNKIIRNSIFKDAAEGILDTYDDEVKPELDEFRTENA
ncbi:MAG: hypothetical protein UHN02_06865 [Acutalibacteraceae bacterium]|nr:hypothetical protein [Acutalibacteraceae bacterium]